MITLQELMDSGWSEKAARYLLRGDYAGARYQQTLDNGSPQEIQKLAFECSLEAEQKRMVDRIYKDILTKVKSIDAKSRS